MGTIAFVLHYAVDAAQCVKVIKEIIIQFIFFLSPN